MTELGKVVRKRLERLALATELPRAWREVLRAEAKALETVVNEWPQLEDLAYRYHNDARFHAFVDHCCAQVLEDYKQRIESIIQGKEEKR